MQHLILPSQTGWHITSKIGCLLPYLPNWTVIIRHQTSEIGCLLNITLSQTGWHEMLPSKMDGMKHPKLDVYLTFYITIPNWMAWSVIIQNGWHETLDVKHILYYHPKLDGIKRNVKNGLLKSSKSGWYMVISLYWQKKESSNCGCVLYGRQNSPNFGWM